jgi:hypothetical protein
MESWAVIKPDENIVISVGINQSFGQLEMLYSLVLFVNNHRLVTFEDSDGYLESSQSVTLKFEISKGILRPGIYTVGLGGRTKLDDYFWNNDLFSFEILEVWESQIQKERIGLINSHEGFCKSYRL